MRTAGDVWSLAITAHEVLTGTLPTLGSDTALSADLPPGWRDLLAECLGADPRARPGIEQVVAATGALHRQARAAAVSPWMAGHVAAPRPPRPDHDARAPVRSLPRTDERAREVARAAATRRLPTVAAAPASPPRRQVAAPAVGGLARLVLTLVWMVLVAGAVVAGLALAFDLVAAELGQRAEEIVDRARTSVETELGSLAEEFTGVDAGPSPEPRG